MILFILGLSEAAEKFRQELEAKYRDHRVTSYKKARWNLYSDVDCNHNQLFRVYSTSHEFECHKSKAIPTTNISNAEHIVPQSFFKKHEPYVSDLHHLFASSQLENQIRSDNPFGEFPQSECEKWYYDAKEIKQQPENPENYNCISKSPTRWMPVKRDRGAIARAVLYFLTVYPEVDAHSLENYTLLLKWNKEYPPDAREHYRNDMVNITQGNRNPYIDNPHFADIVFGELA